MATEDEIRVQKERLSKMSSDAIRGEIPTWKPHAPARIAGEIILEERKNDQSAKHASNDWHNKPIGKIMLGVVIGVTVTVLGLFIKKWLGF